MKIAVANLKAEFGEEETRRWFESFLKEAEGHNLTDKEIIICPSTPFLSLFPPSRDFKLGSQSLSQFEKGTFTGEITAPMLKPLVEYALVGHSEERRVTQETEEAIQAKINLTNKYGIKVILCLESVEKYIGEIYALAYEPSSAIGTGQAEDASVSWQKMIELRANIQAQYYLYGGSVNPDNAEFFTRAGFDGVLVGKKSLEPVSFLSIVDKL